MGSTVGRVAERRLRDRARADLWIPAIYALLSALYIWKSDAWVAAFAKDVAVAERWSTWKGWGFVALTAGLLHLVLRQVLRRLEATARALADSEARYRTLFEESPEAVLITDERRVLLGNRAAARLLAVPAPAAIRDRTIDELIEPADRAVVAERVVAVLEGRADGAAVVRRARRLDGASFLAEIISASIRFRGEPAALVLVRDVTDRVQRQQASARLELALRTLIAWDEAIAVADDERALLDRFCEVAVEVGGLRLAWIARYSGSAEAVPKLVATAGRDRAYVEALLAHWHEERERNAAAAAELQAGRPVVVNDIAGDPRLASRRASAATHGLGAFVVLPLRGGESGDVEGLVTLYAPEPNAFDDAVVGVLAQGVRELAVGLRVIRSRAVLQGVLDHAPAAIMVHDREGKLLLVNRFLAERAGSTPERMLGQHVTEALPALPPAWMRSSEAVIASRAPLHVEEAFEHDGTRMRFDVVKFPLVLDDSSRIDVGAIVTDVTWRRAAEDQLARSREELRALAGELLTVREQEKARIARDLHDDLGQLLTRLKIDVRAMERVLDAMPVGDATAPLLERVVAASELVDETLARVRVIATELRPGSLDALGLGPALEQEARAFRDRSGIPCEVRIEPAAADQRGEVATALFRIAQESLTNVLRHAQAKRVSLSLTLEGEELALRVADDGVGLDPARVSGGLGLVGMRERAGALGGAVKLEHGAGGGTTVTVHIPFAP